MWVVGKLRGYSFEPLSASPSFQSADDAQRWARDYLEADPANALGPGESLTWQKAGKTNAIPQ